MKQEKSKKQSLANGQKNQPEIKTGYKVKSILTFYWMLFISGGIAAVFLAYIGLDYPLKDTFWRYLPRCVWMVALGIIFFDSLNICFLHSTPLYKLIAQKVKKKKLMSRFCSMCCITGGLLLINTITTLHHDNYSQINIVCCLGSFALAWFLTGVLQLTRFR